MIFDTVQAPFMRLPGSCINYNSLPNTGTHSVTSFKKNTASRFVLGVSQREAHLDLINC